MDHDKSKTEPRRFVICSAEEGKRCLGQLSKASLASMTECDLSVIDLEITPSILALLVQILNPPLDRVKWESVYFRGCWLALWSSSNKDDGSLRDNLDRFVSLLATRVFCLALRHSPDILERLRDAPKFEIQYFFLVQQALSPSEVKAFVDCVERNKALKGFSVDSTNVNRCCDSVVNGFHLLPVIIQEMMFLRDVKGGQLEVTDTLIGEGHLGRLLQNSQTKLQKLSLNQVQLEDRHLIAIAQMLPTSHLEVLNVSNNSIGCQGIMAFAQEMPRMKSLKEVHLRWNHWEDAPRKEFDQCCAALVQGLRLNHSITYVRTRRSSPLVHRLGYYGSLNWAGHQIITAPNTFPVGLWSLVLALIGEDGDCPWSIGKYRPYRADIIYFLLRNSTLFKSINSCQTRNSEEGTKKN